MIKYINSTVFNANCEAIVNTINCVGVMGIGLAYEFALRYPELLEEYERKCNLNEIKIGNIFYYKTEDVLVVNFPTKFHFQYPSNIKWIEQGLIDFVKTYKNYNIKSVAFPYLGCSKGQLSIEEVKPLMEKYLSNLDIDVYICSNDLAIAEGKELEMLEALKNIDIKTLGKSVKLNKKQEDILVQNRLKIKRFYDISKLEGIGKTTYEKLFKYFFKNHKEINIEQITLFD